MRIVNLNAVEAKEWVGYMKMPLEFQFTIPRGAQVRVVEDDHPALTRCPLVIATRGVADIATIAHKFWDYRIWHTLRETGSRSDVMPAAQHGRIDAAIQELYRFNRSDPEFLDSLDSVAVTYPKCLSVSVEKQLAELPPHLPLIGEFSSRDNAKSIHIEAESGIKAIAVLEQVLDVEVPNPGVFLTLNSPSVPAWATYISEQGPLPFAGPVTVLNDQQLSERHAWERVYSWCHSNDIPVSGEPYPNGKNNFPDYGALIGGNGFQVEMTTTPGMEKWTIKAWYRDLEKIISEVAQQPSETLAEATSHLSRVVAKKCDRVRKDKLEAGLNAAERYLLVVTNFSTHDLSSAAIWNTSDLAEFDAVLLIQSDVVRCIKWP